MSSLTQVTEKQILRGLVLKICNAAAPLGAGTEVITASLKKEGYHVNKNDVTKACSYLEGKNLIDVKRVENKVLEISRDIASITSRGIDVLEGTLTESGIELG